MSAKQNKPVTKAAFKEILINKIDDYLDHAFATEEAEKRQKYREAVRQIEQLLLTVSEIE